MKALWVLAILLAAAIVSVHGICFDIQFLCKSGQCLNGKNERVCDGSTNCAGGDDESRCGKGNCTVFEFECNNTRCVSGYDVCDGVNNCGDNSDESSCGETSFVSFLVGVIVGSTVFSVGAPLCCIFCIGVCAVGGYFYLEKRKRRRSPYSNNSTTATVQPGAHGDTEKGLLLEQMETRTEKQPVD